MSDQKPLDAIRLPIQQTCPSRCGVAACYRNPCTSDMRRSNILDEELLQLHLYFDEVENLANATLYGRATQTLQPGTGPGHPVSGTRAPSGSEGDRNHTRASSPTDQLVPGEAKGDQQIMKLYKGITDRARDVLTHNGGRVLQANKQGEECFVLFPLGSEIHTRPLGSLGTETVINVSGVYSEFSVLSDEVVCFNAYDPILQF